MADSVKSVRFNVSKIVYSIIEKDDKTAFVHGPIKKVGEPMSVQMAYRIAQGTIYGAGVVQSSDAKVTGVTLKMDVNKIPIEVKAEWYGNKYENGVRTVSKDDTPKNIAIGYEIESTGGKKEYDWLLKGTPQPAGKSTQQTTDNINYSTDTVDINFMPREFDGALHKDADTANSAFTDEMAAIFLDTIPDGTLVTGV